MSGIGRCPGLGQLVMRICPLGNDVGLTLITVLLKPSSMSGATRCPAFGPLAYFTIGPSIVAIRFLSV